MSKPEELSVTEKLVRWQYWIRGFSLEEAEELSSLLEAVEWNSFGGRMETLLRIYWEFSRRSEERARGRWGSGPLMRMVYPLGSSW
jgi:sulfite reductase beta subunit-like hemoprotein